MENQENKHLKKSNRMKMIIIMLLILLILLLCGIGYLLLCPPEEKVPAVAPDYAPQQLEPNAEPTDEPEDTPKYESEEGGGKVTIGYNTDMIIDLSDQKAYWNYNNPKASNQDVVVRLIIQDQVILQSGLIKAGNEIKELDINGQKIKMGVGNYTGKVELCFYHPETGERAVLSTDLTNITIKVQE